VFLKEFSEVTASANGTIQILLGIIDEIRGMVGSAIALAAETLKQLHPVHEMTNALSGSVEQVFHRMNLVALNAQIQAVQIGAGTGLEVLAAHTASIASETSKLGVAINDNLEKLRAFLNSEVAGLNELCEAGRIQQTYLEKQGRAHEAELHAERDRILALLQHLGSGVQGVCFDARRCAQAAVVGRGEAEGLSKLGSALEGLAQVLSSGWVRSESERGGFDLDTSSYTMEAERVNHALAVGHIAAGLEEQRATSGGDAGEIELF